MHVFSFALNFLVIIYFKYAKDITIIPCIMYNLFRHNAVPITALTERPVTVLPHAGAWVQLHNHVLGEDVF